MVRELIHVAGLVEVAVDAGMDQMWQSHRVGGHDRLAAGQCLQGRQALQFGTSAPAARSPARTRYPRSAAASGRANNTALTPSGWTSISGTDRNASRCRPAPSSIATMPNTQRGRRTRCTSSRHPATRVAGAALASCCCTAAQRRLRNTARPRRPHRSPTPSRSYCPPSNGPGQKPDTLACGSYTL
jgi:hypothetical protein